jgi:hypothetical protein
MRVNVYWIGMISYYTTAVGNESSSIFLSDADIFLVVSIPDRNPTTGSRLTRKPASFYPHPSRI